jgi:hypothetical protein
MPYLFRPTPVGSWNGPACASPASTPFAEHRGQPVLYEGGNVRWQSNVYLTERLAPGGWPADPAN